MADRAPRARSSTPTATSTPPRTRRSTSRTTRFEDWLTLGFFWLLALDVFYQFFTRYVLNDSAAWTEEIARYLLIVVVFVGASMGVRRNTPHPGRLPLPLPAAAGRRACCRRCVDVVRIAFFAYAVVADACS